MKKSTVTINLNNLKKDINNHYFKYRDIFYRILITCICINRNFKDNMLQNTIIEDSQYNQYFMYLYNKNLNVEQLLSELNINDNLLLYIDLSLYIEEFIYSKHSESHVNVYSISIEDDGNINIVNKKIHKGNINV